MRTASASSVRTTRAQRTKNARTAYEQRASSVRELVRTTRELRANYERELTRELRDAPVGQRARVESREHGNILYFLHFVILSRVPRADFTDHGSVIMTMWPWPMTTPPYPSRTPPQLATRPPSHTASPHPHPSAMRLKSLYLSSLFPSFSLRSPRWCVMAPHSAAARTRRRDAFP